MFRYARWFPLQVRYSQLVLILDIHDNEYQLHEASSWQILAKSHTILKIVGFDLISSLPTVSIWIITQLRWTRNAFGKFTIINWKCAIKIWCWNPVTSLYENVNSSPVEEKNMISELSALVHQFLPQIRPVTPTIRQRWSCSQTLELASVPIVGQPTNRISVYAMRNFHILINQPEKYR